MPPTFPVWGICTIRTQCASIQRLPILSAQQVRNATLIRRPKRPYTFTQLITLSDGSSFMHRTTSPTPVYKSTRDTRNTPLWNPSNARMANVEEDEAGRLRAFRRRFGRAFDSAATESTASAPPGARIDQATVKADTDALEGKREQLVQTPSPIQEDGVPGYSRKPSPASKTEDGTAPRGAGSQISGSSAMDDTHDEDDNLMDLLNSYAGQESGHNEGGASARVVQRGGGESAVRGKGKKR